ncbi:CCR4-Not complex component, Not1-domain-containing protein [Polychytrium aggregatum]|uniref:CCR4-Not complex component, Not1-domain-containing protein n=1 Tax=Polychytrium aggregatum TaxID=110093 RepID=UPI0022FEFE6B|nr:CCR4-Not complex component, Not1-domain-containing protein [Polychytrium aggregatum]KAI9207851.1 CCR4-Not complex component, Not1-domain-containing protein [Polychytrium aggregatum]
MNHLPAAHTASFFPNALAGNVDEASAKQILGHFSTLNFATLPAKVLELKGLLQTQYYPFVCRHIVFKEISRDSSVIPLFLDLFQSLNIPELDHVSLTLTVASAKAILGSDEIVVSPEQRLALRNLGVWLSGLNLRRWKLVKAKHPIHKELVLDLMEIDRLTVAIPFICNVMDCCNSASQNFRPASPWGKALLRSVSDFYQVKLNIRAEVDELEHLGSYQAHYPVSRQNFSADLVVKPAAGLAPDTLRRCLYESSRRTIDEVMEYVVDRCVSIATNTTRLLLHRDFAPEHSEANIKTAIRILVQSLAAALSNVVSRDSIRQRTKAHMVEIFKAAAEVPVSEFLVSSWVADNLEVLSLIIERATFSTAAHEVDRLFSVYREQLARGLEPFRRLGTNSSVGLAREGSPKPIRPALSGGFPDLESLQSPVPSTSARRFSQLLIDLETIIAQNSSLSLATLPNQQDIKHSVQQSLVFIDKFPARSTQQEEFCTLFVQKILQLLYQYPDSQLAREVFVVMLQKLTEVSKKAHAEIQEWLLYADTERKLSVPVMFVLVQSRLLPILGLDVQLARYIQSAQPSEVEFAIDFIKKCLLEKTDADHALCSRIDLLTSLDALAHQKSAGTLNESGAALLDQLRSQLRSVGDIEHESLQEQLSLVFAEWIRIYQHPYSSERIQGAYIEEIFDRGIVDSNDSLHIFLRTCTEASLDEYVHKTAFLAPAAPPTSSDRIVAVDAFARLIVMILKRDLLRSDDTSIDQAAAEGEAANTRDPMYLTTKSLSIITLVLVHRHKELSTEFNPQPFYRLFSTILSELEASRSVLKGKYVKILVCFGNALHNLRPSLVPGFAFAWLQLVSHRYFMPKLLLAKRRKGWSVFERLLSDLHQFITPLPKDAESVDKSMLTLYKGAARVFLILIHDFPELLKEKETACSELVESLKALNVAG